MVNNVHFPLKRSQYFASHFFLDVRMAAVILLALDSSHTGPASGVCGLRSQRAHALLGSMFCWCCPGFLNVSVHSEQSTSCSFYTVSCRLCSWHCPLRKLADISIPFICDRKAENCPIHQRAFTIKHFCVFNSSGREMK